MATRALAGKSWITTYFELIDKVSEAPVNFNIWGAISAVSAVMKNHCYVDRGTYNVYPNQFIILIGPPGIGKGSSIHPVFDIPVNLGLINLVSDRITVPKMLEKLAKGFPGQPVASPLINLAPNPAMPSTNGFHPDTRSATIKAMELQTLLGAAEGMTTFLCESWDRKSYEYDTKTAGTSIVSDMCTSLVGACVPNYIQAINRESHTASSVNGGFTARSIFVYGDKKSKRIPFPVPFEKLPGGVDIVKRLDDDMIAISNLHGEYTMNTEAKAVFEAFYDSTDVVHIETDSDVVQYFKSRIVTHAIKVAMALSAAAGDSLIINKQDMQLSINVLQQVLQNLDRTFRGYGTNLLAEPTARIQEFIERQGVTTRKELLKNYHKFVTTPELDEIISLLRQIDFVREEHQGGQIVLILNGSSSGPVRSSIKDLIP